MHGVSIDIYFSATFILINLSKVYKMGKCLKFKTHFNFSCTLGGSDIHEYIEMYSSSK